MIWTCRILLLFVFALFWGGLTFYTGFVVRVSHDVLPDLIDGGLITQRVTVLLQYLGLVSAALMLMNSLQLLRNARVYGIILLVLTSILLLSLVGLFLVHGQLDAVIDVEAREILDRDAFTIGHRRYNQLTAVEWIACVIYVPISLLGWRCDDRRSRTPQT
ncbi:MAG: hypothetical protein AAFX06_00380 [Planctomycetota bacterium]